MSRATISDVAKRAGVTKATVSHTLSGKRPVAAETRARIEAAIAELGYRPSSVAQRLAAGRSGAVGFAYPLNADESLGEATEVLGVAEATLASAGYALVLFGGAVDGVAALQTFTERGLLDGVLLGQVTSLDSRTSVLADGGIPFVLLGRTSDNSGMSFVDTDIDEAVEMCVERLVVSGHQRLAFLHEDARRSAGASRAVHAYERACARRRLRLVAPVCPASTRAGQEVAGRLLQQQGDVTGLVVGGEGAAIGVLHAAQHLGLRVPQDLSLVCLGKTAIGNLAPQELTCVDLRHGEQARQATDILLERLGEGNAGDQQVLIEPRWHEGATLAAVR
jgi:DNA-binding LacI/PurR family transcriptional regulator